VLTEADFRRFAPLEPNHPAIGPPCAICGQPFKAGDETTLVPHEPAPANRQRHTVEASLCHWRCVMAALRMAREVQKEIMSDLSWTPPRTAVTPANHFHTLHMRLAAINEELLRGAGGREAILKNEAFTQLVVAIGDATNLAARMTAMLEGIRRDFPEVWEIWQRAVAHEPTQEEVKA